MPPLGNEDIFSLDYCIRIYVGFRTEVSQSIRLHLGTVAREPPT